MDGDDDMFPTDLPSVPRMRKNAAEKDAAPANAGQQNAGSKRKVRSQSPRSDAGADEVPRRERKKRFAPAPGRPERSSLKDASPAAESPRSESESSDVDAMKDVSREKPKSQSRAPLRRRAGQRKKRISDGDSDSNSDAGIDEDSSLNAEHARAESSSEEVLPSSGKRRAGRREVSFKGSSSKPSSSVGAGSDREENDSGSSDVEREGDGNDDDEVEGHLESHESSDSDSNDPMTNSGQGGKLQPLSLEGDEKALDDYSEDESLGSEGEAVGKPGDSSSRLTVRQRAMQGEELGTELTKLASPRHKKKRKPPSEDLTKDEEKAIKSQQKARLRHMVHEKRNKEKRAAMVDKVLRGVTSKRKKLSLAAETYVAEAGARLAKNSARDDCYRYTSKKEGSFVSIPAAMETPQLLDVPRRATAYPPKCARDPKTGKRIFAQT